MLESRSPLLLSRANNSSRLQDRDILGGLILIDLLYTKNHTIDIWFSDFLAIWKTIHMLIMTLTKSNSSGLLTLC
jgi:hypothetical protein